MKILFIAHETSRTGAPIVLLNFLGWLRENQKDFSISVLDLNSGDLQVDFKKVADEYYDYRSYVKENRLFIEDLKKRLKNKIGYSTNKERKLFEKLANKDFDLIYSNTILSIPAAVAIKNINTIPLVLHIHELNYNIKNLLPGFGGYLEKIDHYIAVSKMVQKNLMDHWSINGEKISVVYEFIKSPKAEGENKRTDKFIVGSSGLVSWRKGYDLFIQVAKYVIKHYPEIEIEFVWIGKLRNDIALRVEHELVKLDLQEKVKFLGELENPFIEYQQFDLFLLPSREDPFPLVCIELGMMGKSIICFEYTTGISEVLDKSTEAIIPYADIPKMAERIIEYYYSPEERSRHGKINKEIFKEFNVENQSPKIFKTIKDQVVNNERRG